MMDWITDPSSWIALLTLAALEIVLGIDNIIFISILAGRLPAESRNRARLTGLAAAMISRIGLLFSLSWVMSLTEPFFSAVGRSFSGRDLILLGGGLFLIYKSVSEIHQQQQGEEETVGSGNQHPSFWGVIVQIFFLDIVFSLDSVITAVGMVDQIVLMVLAVMVAVGIMMFFSGPVAGFVERNPTVKTLALAFLVLIGVALIADGFGQHIPKGYIYFSIAFAVSVEFLNLRLRRKQTEAAARPAPEHKAPTIHTGETLPRTR